LPRHLAGGDADAFAALVDRLSPAMIRVALAHVPNLAAAEEVVQEPWIAVMRGIVRFEGRASVKTWIFRILANWRCAAAPAGDAACRSRRWRGGERGRAGGRSRSLPPRRPHHLPHWAVLPTRWPTPDEGLIADETRAIIAAAIAALSAGHGGLRGAAADRLVAVLRGALPAVLHA
jgi:RNA polymerase sigma-70 factor, ECF subfamily